jgi:glycosyltransferase involved in cell wall biosynthesis
MKAAIIYNQFYDSYGNTIKVGGAETYLTNLAKLLSEMTYSVTIFQTSHLEFKRKMDNISIIGVPIANFSKNRVRHAMYQRANHLIDKTNDLLIFGADNLSVPTKYPKAISIQHGVSWDLPARYFTRKSGAIAQIVSKFRKYVAPLNAARYFNNCLNRVCVDYNYLNWYRTICLSEPKGRIWVIPNFMTQSLNKKIILERHKINRSEIEVLFARRFTKIRGTELMIHAIKEISCRYKNVKFTFAGEGEEDERLRTELRDYKVTFTKYASSQSMEFHSNYDIAVIPSLGSEGTSLSVIEAMGAGCAVVATSIGGITNIVIDDYNGLLISPDSKALVHSLEKLINDRNLRLRLGQNAYNTAVYSFSLEKWKARWSNVIREVSNGF